MPLRLAADQGLAAPGKAVAILVVLGFISIPFFASRSAWSVPGTAWDRLGRSRTRWTIALFVFPFGIAWISSLLYFVFVRRSLHCTRDVQGLKPGSGDYRERGTRVVLVSESSRWLPVREWRVRSVEREGEWRCATSSLFLAPDADVSIDLESQQSRRSLPPGQGKAHTRLMRRRLVLLGGVEVALGCLLIALTASWPDLATLLRSVLFSAGAFVIVSGFVIIRIGARRPAVPPDDA